MCKVWGEEAEEISWPANLGGKAMTAAAAGELMCDYVLELGCKGEVGEEQVVRVDGLLKAFKLGESMPLRRYIFPRLLASFNVSVSARTPLSPPYLAH